MNSHPKTNRRHLLQSASCGFGALAFQSLLAQSTDADASSSLTTTLPMLPQRAKRIIFIFMQGGPSHVDSFDYKPDLIDNHDKSIDFTGVRFGTFGQQSQRKLMKPLWRFTQHGQCGQHVSELFPHIANHVDDLCFLKGMHTEGVAHGPSTLFMHTGATNLVRPSLGSWLMYGLGSENHNLPGFITLQPSNMNGGPRNYSNAFLPDVHQGTAIGGSATPFDKIKIPHINPSAADTAVTRQQFDLLQQLNHDQLQRRRDTDNRLNAVIETYELAWKMQATAPQVLDLSGETSDTQTMYGIGDEPTDQFGRQCLLARRLSESGVRFVQINYADESANPRWDQHSQMHKHMIHARASDKPVAGLLADLKQRGLLDDTLVWWGGEFGRTPFSQGNNGRDHNPKGFTVFLAGGGVKPGFSWGGTDEIGRLAVTGKIHMHDLHATILHQLGIDHEQLTYRYAGRDFRLTDVFGRVVNEILS
jgi:hypothetical protein